jgi:aminoglycoside 3-N-acetyltransferase
MPVTRSRMAEDLRRLGLRTGDILLVHSSMKSLGQVEGGPEAVVDALLEVLGADGRAPEGLLIVPTLSNTFIGRDTGTAEYAFDRTTTPSRVGLITNTVRQRPNALRSGHPTHSLAAIGRRAAELVADGLHLPRTFDRTGPYGRYVRWRAKILFLGCTLAANTTFHAVEDWLELPYIANWRGRALVHRHGRNVPMDITFVPGGHRDFYSKDRRTKIEQVLSDAGALTEGRVGEARCLLLSAQDCVRLTAERILTEPDILLCDTPTCEFCAAGRRDSRAALAAIRARAAALRDQGALP